LQDFTIIFVPGIKPKPPPDLHRDLLLRCLSAGLSRGCPDALSIVSEHPARFRLCSWTYDFHGSHRNPALDIPGIERLLANPDPTPEDIREIESISRHFGRLTRALGDAYPTFGRWLAPDDLRLTLREARRYLLNRGGAAIPIREGLAAVLMPPAERGDRIMVLAHSFGSVIAYDTLWQLAHEDRSPVRIDLLVTLGSPLSTRFVRRHVKGAHLAGPKRYPNNIRRWCNFAAKGEHVAFHPRLRPLFSEMIELGLVEDIEDRIDIYNHFHTEKGINPHKSYGYLAHTEVGKVVGDWVLEGYSS
jgi:hypothetical protein